jgi:hypothetical protein
MTFGGPQGVGRGYRCQGGGEWPGSGETADSEVVLHCV